MEHFTLHCDYSFVFRPPHLQKPFQKEEINIPKLYYKKGPLVPRVNLQSEVPLSFSDKSKENVSSCRLPFMCFGSLLAAPVT